MLNDIQDEKRCSEVSTFLPRNAQMQFISLPILAKLAFACSSFVPYLIVLTHQSSTKAFLRNPSISCTCLCSRTFANSYRCRYLSRCLKYMDHDVDQRRRQEMQNEKRKRRAKRKGDTPKVHRSYWPVKPGHHRKLSSVTTRCLNRKNVLPPHSPGFELFILRCGTQEIYSLLHDSMHLYGHLYVALFTSATPILELHLTPCCCFLFVSRAIELKNRDGQD